jgi:uncharacterized membrane protein YcaP (DUF421 family)
LAFSSKLKLQLDISAFSYKKRLPSVRNLPFSPTAYACARARQWIIRLQEDVVLQDLMAFSVSPAEIIIRGTLMYWFLFLLFRFLLRRDIGTVGIGDFLFVVIVADASQNAMSGDAKTVADGILLVITLVFWNFLIDYVSYKWALVRRFTEPPSVILVKNGKPVLRNMRREYITRSDLHAKMREEGIEDIAKVKEMRLESDGTISVIQTD